MKLDQSPVRAVTLALTGAFLLSGAACGKKANHDAGAASPPPAAHAPGGAVAAGGPTMTAAGLTWTVPADWVAETPSSSMRLAQYRIPSNKSGVEDGLVTVFHFGPGGGGGIEANLARWAGQFTQPDGSDPMSKAKIDHFDAGALKASTIDLLGRYQTSGMMGGGRNYDEPGWRLIGGILEGPGGPWFFKVVGPAEVLDGQMDSFLAMLRGAHAA